MKACDSFVNQSSDVFKGDRLNGHIQFGLAISMSHFILVFESIMVCFN